MLTNIQLAIPGSTEPAGIIHPYLSNTKKTFFLRTFKFASGSLSGVGFPESVKEVSWVYSSLGLCYQVDSVKSRLWDAIKEP